MISVPVCWCQDPSASSHCYDSTATTLQLAATSHQQRIIPTSSASSESRLLYDRLLRLVSFHFHLLGNLISAERIIGRPGSIAIMVLELAHFVTRTLPFHERCELHAEWLRRLRRLSALPPQVELGVRTCGPGCMNAILGAAGGNICRQLRRSADVIPVI
jgi:hypothetical protein